MATKVPFSLSDLKMGNVDASGAMGTALTTFDDPVENTCVFVEATGTDATFNTEISDDPFFKFTTPGQKTIEADFYGKNAAQLKKCFGGTIVPGSAGAPDKWNAPLSTFTQEQSVELTHRNGSKLQFPRVAVKCRFEWNARKNALPLIHFVGTIMKPTDGTTSPVSYIDAPST